MRARSRLSTTQSSGASGRRSSRRSSTCPRASDGREDSMLSLTSGGMMRGRSLVLCVSLLAALAGGALPTRAQSDSDQCSRESYTPSQRAGCRIWFYATAGNDRFHTYVFQQRLGVLIDWYRVLDAQKREQRFATWGLINDPDCCRPGAPGCPAKSLDETDGFDWCPGDAELLKYVGQEKIDGKPYRDPACDLAEGEPDASDEHPHPALA